MPKTESTHIFNASGLVMGRLASAVAKRLLDGERIVVINAEKVLVSGKKHSKLNEIKAFLAVGSVANPKYGPFHPRKPDTILRGTIRGMLPWDRARGKAAYRRLKVYVGLPDEYKDKPAEILPEAVAKPKTPYIRLGELAKEIGWKPEGES